MDVTVILNGIVSDDGLPNPPGVVTTTWSAESGPGAVTFSDPSASITTASFTVEGVYVLRLTANDGEFSVHDDMSVTVNPENQAPLVVAGAYATVDLDSPIVSLNGTVSDDGLPTPQVRRRQRGPWKAAQPPSRSPISRLWQPQSPS